MNALDLFVTADVPGWRLDALRVDAVRVSPAHDPAPSPRSSGEWQGNLLTIRIDNIKVRVHASARLVPQQNSDSRNVSCAPVSQRERLLEHIAVLRVCMLSNLAARQPRKVHDNLPGMPAKPPRSIYVAHQNATLLDDAQRRRGASKEADDCRPQPIQHDRILLRSHP